MTWVVKCPSCKGTGRRRNALLIEPPWRQLCKVCWGTGFVEAEKGDKSKQKLNVKGKEV